ncbi:hypothetical protein ABRG53_4182 [Pseudanabaena sp. ABRG5-3]|nr:hypothetical protein ABRG53_4182 [Pseudanabaena sp. ABRG5-3]
MDSSMYFSSTRIAPEGLLADLAFIDVFNNYLGHRFGSSLKINCNLSIASQNEGDLTMNSILFFKILKSFAKLD